MPKIKRPSQVQANRRKSLNSDENIRFLRDKLLSLRNAKTHIQTKRLLDEALLFRLIDECLLLFHAFLKPTLHKARPPLGRLSSLTDWVPSPVIRKRQRKLLSDEAAEIIQFRAEGRRWLARWRLAWTWFYWFFYLISGPFSMVTRAIRKFIV